MSDTPHDAASLIDWFTADEIVRHDGSRSPREPHMTRAEAEMLAAKIGADSPYKGCGVMTAPAVWNLALSGALFMSGRFGWIDRAGRFWGCNHAAHETLLYFMDMDIIQAEQAGMVRVSMSGLQCAYQPSDAQLRTLERLGLTAGAARLLDQPKPPARLR